MHKINHVVVGTIVWLATTHMYTAASSTSDRQFGRKGSARNSFKHHKRALLTEKASSIREPLLNSQTAGSTDIAALNEERPLPMQEGSRRESQRLRECMAVKSELRPFTVQDFIDGKPARLKPELELSTKAPAAFGVTAVTAYSLGRIAKLHELCASWGGPLSAAVYVGLRRPSLPLQTEEHEEQEAETPDSEEEEYDEGDLLVDSDPLQTAITVVRQTFDIIEQQKGGCQLSITLFSELLAGDDEDMLYPVNALRNAALLAAKTPLVFSVDGDMLLSSSLTTGLKDTVRLQQMLRVAEQKVFIVVPAFEATNLPASSAAVSSKTTALELLQRREIRRFAEHYPAGHAATNYTRWAASTSGSFPFYETKYQDGFEGWGIISRHLAPMWDVKFRGYGYNKIAWTVHLHRIGFRFVVSSEHYMVHRPHRHNPAKAEWAASVLKGREAEKRASAAVDEISSKGLVPSKLLSNTNSKHFYGDSWLFGQHRYRTVVGNSDNCRRQLPHWQIYGPNGTYAVA